MSNQIVAPATTMCPAIEPVELAPDIIIDQTSEHQQTASWRLGGMFHLLAAYLKATGLLGFGWLLLWIIDHIAASYAVSGAIPFLPATPWRPSATLLMLMSGNMFIVQHAAATMSFWWPFVPLAIFRLLIGDVFTYMITRRSLDFIRECRQSRPVTQLREGRAKARLRTATSALRKVGASASSTLRLDRTLRWIHQNVERLCNSDGWWLMLGLFLVKASPVPMPVPAAMLAATTNAKRWRVAVAIVCGAFVKVVWLYWTATTLRLMSL